MLKRNYLHQAIAIEAMENRLLLAAAGDVWDRSADWTPGATQGSTAGNPDAGVKSGGAWQYESVALFAGGTANKGALGQDNVWHKDISSAINTADTKLIWDTSWFGGNGGWTGGDNINPLVQPTTVIQGLSGTRVPIVRWLNQITGGAVVVALSGNLTFSWNANGGSALNKPIEFIMMLQNPDGTKTPLVMETRLASETVGIAIDLPAVKVPVGASIFYTFRYEDPASRPGWITLNDDNLTVTLKSLGPLPQPVNDAAVTDKNIATNINVLANDNWAPQKLPRVSILTSPANGAAVVEADQSITYTPAADFVGTDAFTYKIFDGTNNSSSRTVTMTVNNPYYLYVSPTGNNAGAGTSWETALQTLEGARNKIRTLRTQNPSPLAGKSVAVYLADGTYRTDHTIGFDATDSGASSALPVTYYAAGSNAVVKGSKLLTGLAWALTPDQTRNPGAFVADLSASGLTQAQLNAINSLFVDEVRAARAREPDVGYYTIASSPDPTDSFVYRNTDLDPWFGGLPVSETQRAEILHYTNWKESRMRVSSIDAATKLVTVQGSIQNANGGYDDDYGGPSNGTARYYVENILRGLDTPGEWYLDPVAKKLYYKPLPGQDISAATFEVPIVKELIKLTGTRDAGFQGIKFTQTDWSFADFTGIPTDAWSSLYRAVNSASVQPGQVGNSMTLFQDPKNNLSAIALAGTNNISFVKNTFTNNGYYAIRADWLAGETTIVRNTFLNNGAGSIITNGFTGTRGDSGDDGQTNVSRKHRFALNVSHDNQDVWRCAPDMFVTRSGDNWITGNTIYNAEYEGLHVGWFDTKLDARGHNRVLWNNISNVMQTGYDGGGIYVIGYQPGTVVMGNKVSGVTYTDKHLYHGDAGPLVGIYTDETVGDILVMGNIIADANYGLFSNPARSMFYFSNIIVDARKEAMHFYYYTDAEKLANSNFLHQGQNWWKSNVIAWTKPLASPYAANPYLVGDDAWRSNNTIRFTMDQDILSYGPVSVNTGGNLARLQGTATGGGVHDTNAKVWQASDPQLFVNPATLDYRIASTAQALVKANGFAADWLIVPVPAPSSSSLQINDGTAQRSKVTSLTVTFDQAVTLGSDAFTLLRRSGTSNFALSILNPSGDQKNYVISFTGADIISNSLADGVYDLTIKASSVVDAYGQTLTGGNRVYTFHRLFGDANGDRTVTNFDYSQFKKTYGLSTGSPSFNAAFDYDGNGTITNFDYSQFKKRYGLSLSY